MPTRRQRRVNALLREALSELLQREVSDPRLEFASVTDVETTSDLKTAHAYVTFFGDPEHQQEGMRALQKASGYLRRQLAQKVYLRFLPELVFHLDSSTERSLRIERILQDLGSSRDGEEE
jgi:ribosome-binding factor A